MNHQQTIIFTILIILLSGLNLQAQQEVMLNGVLLEKGTKTRIAEADITNKRNNYITSSNAMGLFNIKAKTGDTLLVTKLYYADVIMVVRSETSIVIPLVRNANMLNEVVITRRRVVDDLKRDFKNAPPPSGKPSALSYVFSPVSAIYGLLSTEGKNARRLSRYYDYETKASQVDLFYNKSIIQKNTGLEGKELEDFMVTYRPDYEKSKNWTQYDANKWIVDSFKKYKETKKSPF